VFNVNYISRYNEALNAQPKDERAAFFTEIEMTWLRKYPRSTFAEMVAATKKPGD